MGKSILPPPAAVAAERDAPETIAWLFRPYVTAYIIPLKIIPVHGRVAVGSTDHSTSHLTERTAT
jgi:hypothetical protein